MLRSHWHKRVPITRKRSRPLRGTKAFVTKFRRIDVRRLKPTIWLPINRAMLGTATFVGSQGWETDAAKWTSRLNRTQRFIALAISAAPASFRCNNSRNARNAVATRKVLRSFAGYERNINADKIRNLRRSLCRLKVRKEEMPERENAWLRTALI